MSPQNLVFPYLRHHVIAKLQVLLKSVMLSWKTCMLQCWPMVDCFWISEKPRVHWGKTNGFTYVYIYKAAPIDLIVNRNHNVLWDRKGSNITAHGGENNSGSYWGGGVIVLLPFRSHHALRWSTLCWYSRGLYTSIGIICKHTCIRLFILDVKMVKVLKNCYVESVLISEKTQTKNC